MRGLIIVAALLSLAAVAVSKPSPGEQELARLLAKLQNHQQEQQQEKAMVQRNEICLPLSNGEVECANIPDLAVELQNRLKNRQQTRQEKAMVQRNEICLPLSNGEVECANIPDLAVELQKRLQNRQQTQQEKAMVQRNEICLPLSNGEVECANIPDLGVELQNRLKNRQQIQQEKARAQGRLDSNEILKEFDSLLEKLYDQYTDDQTGKADPGFNSDEVLTKLDKVLQNMGEFRGKHCPTEYQLSECTTQDECCNGWVCAKSPLQKPKKGLCVQQRLVDAGMFEVFNGPEK